jgi:hypothetical protein
VALTALAETCGWHNGRCVRDPETYPAVKKLSEMHRYLRRSDGPEMPRGVRVLEKVFIIPSPSSIAPAI